MMADDEKAEALAVRKNSHSASSTSLHDLTSCGGPSEVRPKFVTLTFHCPCLSSPCSRSCLHRSIQPRCRSSSSLLALDLARDGDVAHVEQLQQPGVYFVHQHGLVGQRTSFPCSPSLLALDLKTDALRGVRRQYK